jgi:DNA-directed RNA polymerase subunit delta
MAKEYALKITRDVAKEIPMVDLAFEILRSAKTEFYYRDLMKEIALHRALSEDDMLHVMAQVYTEINIDGRFACVGTNMWGLKRWYAVEKADDSLNGNTKRPRIINDEDDLDDEELYVEEEDVLETASEETDDYDNLDEDRDTFYDEEEEVGEKITEEDPEEEEEESTEELDEEIIEPEEDYVILSEEDEEDEDDK